MTNSVLKEYKKTEKKLRSLTEKRKTMPEGVIRKRVIRGREYYYLQYRDGTHVRSRYLRADEVSGMQKQIDERKTADEEIRKQKKRLSTYAQLLGIHTTYRPVKNVDYDEYTRFMSSVAHDYKRLGREEFLESCDLTKHRGINKRYLRGFMDYISGIKRMNTRKTNDLVLDPYTYLMYYKYGDKTALEEELPKAIPAFLNQGLLITQVQEAVHGAFNN